MFTPKTRNCYWCIIASIAREVTPDSINILRFTAVDATILRMLMFQLMQLSKVFVVAGRIQVFRGFYFQMKHLYFRHHVYFYI